ncbi:hypothetical protein FKM82_026980 [Ascaphus truei]
MAILRMPMADSEETTCPDSEDWHRSDWLVVKFPRCDRYFMNELRNTIRNPQPFRTSDSKHQNSSGKFEMSKRCSERNNKDTGFRHLT